MSFALSVQERAFWYKSYYDEVFVYVYVRPQKKHPFHREAFFQSTLEDENRILEGTFAFKDGYFYNTKWQ